MCSSCVVHYGVLGCPKIKFKTFYLWEMGNIGTSIPHSISVLHNFIIFQCSSASKCSHRPFFFFP